MKRITLLLILTLSFLIFNSSLRAQYATIPDANFVTWLTQNYPGCMNGNQLDTTCSAVVNDTAIFFNNQPSMNLSGIEYFDSLKTLDVIMYFNNNANKIKIPEMPRSLKTFKVDHVDTVFIYSLPPTLKTFYNDRSYFPLLPSLPNSLTELTLLSNTLASLPPLPNSLKKMYVSWGLTTIPVLPNSLVSLRIENCNFPSLPNVPTSLVDLKIIFNYNSSFTTIPTIPNTLRKVVLNSDTYFTLLPALKNIKHLECIGANIQNLPGIPTALEYLDVSYNSLYDINMYGSSLDTVYCRSNGLNSIINIPGSLKILDCSDNYIHQFGLNPNNNLVRLNCSSNNFLTNLPQLKSSLKYLNASYTHIDSLPSTPANLDTLIFHGAVLTSMGVITSSVLTYMDVSNNYLNSLPALPNSLINLNASHNNLTSLPPIPMNMASLDISYNQLQEIGELPMNMFRFYANNNNIHCFYNLPDKLPGMPYVLGSISQNPFTCLPNLATYSPSIGNVQICSEGNMNTNPFLCQNAANILGYTYYDNSGDCSYNNGESTFHQVPVDLYSNTNTFLQRTYTYHGEYHFNSVPSGTYQVKVNDTLSLSCGQTNQVQVQLSTVNPSSSNNNFPLACDSMKDYRIESAVTMYPVRPGAHHFLLINLERTSNYISNFCNPSLLNVAGNIVISVMGPAHLSTSYSASTPFYGSNPTSVNWNVYTFQTNNLDSLIQSNIILNLLVDTTATASDMICIHAVVNPVSADVNLLNNQLDFCYPVRNSFDPNCKDVYPTNISPGYQDWLTYTIHFQNTGNDFAQTVKLRDTLDTYLDPSTFEFLSASHQVTTTVNGRVITARFNNIMLPDSTSNLVGSMGYFQFRVKPYPNIANGLQILNRAHIFFDYNTAVVTNTTQNIVSCITNNLQNIQLCHGDSIQVGTHWYAHSGAYMDTLQTAAGCDSILTTIVNEISIDTSVTVSSNSLSVAAGYLHYDWLNCSNNQSLTVDSNLFTPMQSGSYQVLITAQNACTAMSACYTMCISSSLQQSYTICHGDSVEVGTHWYQQSGSYVDTLVTEYGCDSIITTTVIETTIDTALTINSTSLLAQSGYLNYEWRHCNDPNNLATGANQFSPAQSGTYQVLITTQNACSALSTCRVICIENNVQQTLNLCSGDSIQVGTHWYDAAGTYIDNLISSFGCDSTVTSFINISNIDTSLLVVSDSIFAMNNYAFYRWKDCSNDSIIQASTSAMFVAPYNGLFRVSITDTSACEASSSCVSIITTGIAQVSKKSSVQLLPNPAKDEVSVRIQHANYSQLTIRLSDVRGCEVFHHTEAINGNYEKKYDVSHLAKGIYFLQIMMDGNMEMKKLIIE